MPHRGLQRILNGEFVRGTRLRTCAVLAMLAVVLVAGRAEAQVEPPIIVTEPGPHVVFGESVTWQVAVRAPADITAISLHWRAGAEPEMRQTVLGFQPGQVVVTTVVLHQAQAALPPFSPVIYWWVIADRAGHSLTTAPATFAYEDNRFAWRQVALDRVVVNWYEGDDGFGQRAAQIANASLIAANADIRAPLPEQTAVYIYANDVDVQAALGRVGYAWADGHADVALGLAVVAMAPDLSAEFNLRRELPHELTHLLLYRATGKRYNQVPVWLNEGLAVMNQTQPEPDFPGLLTAARDTRSFLSFSALCGAFPSEAAEARLAYAQSESLVRLIRSRFGTDSLHNLLSSYASGAECDAGVQTALGLSLSKLESDWLRDEMFASPVKARWLALSPWLLLSAMVLCGPALFFVFAGRQKLAAPAAEKHRHGG